MSTTRELAAALPDIDQPPLKSVGRIPAHLRPRGLLEVLAEATNPLPLRPSFDVLLRVAQLVLALCLPVVGWTFARVQDHEVRLVRIESSRFTSRDAKELLTEFQANYPPAWLRDDMVELKATMRSVEQRMLKLERGLPSSHEDR